MCNHAQESPLLIAALKGSTACVRAILQSPSHKLLEHNIWLNPTPASTAKKQSSKTLKAEHQEASRRQHGWSPVHAACMAGDVLSLDMLLKQVRDTG